VPEQARPVEERHTADTLQIPPGKVKTTLRRHDLSRHTENDLEIDPIRLAEDRVRLVKLVPDREDDVEDGQDRRLTVQDLEARLDDDGFQRAKR
jgi:hypothetical protein